MRGSLEKRFTSDHPTAAGHFPGNPIIPGALVLDAVLAAIAGDGPRAQSCELRVAKFLLPIRPGDRIRIDWYVERDDIRFKCVLIDGNEVALTGTIRVCLDAG